MEYLPAFCSEFVKIYWPQPDPHAAYRDTDLSVELSKRVSGPTTRTCMLSPSKLYTLR